MIGWLIMATTPAPPEPTTRKVGLPEFAAECLVVGRTGKTQRLSVRVSGQAPPSVKIDDLPPRTLRFSTKSPELLPLDNVELPSASSSVLGWGNRWQTSDYSFADIGSQRVSIRMLSGDNLDIGVGIEIQENGPLTVPLYAGMCTAKSAKENTAK